MYIGMATLFTCPRVATSAAVWQPVSVINGPRMYGSNINRNSERHDRKGIIVQSHSRKADGSGHSAMMYLELVVQTSSIVIC